MQRFTYCEHLYITAVTARPVLTRLTNAFAEWHHLGAVTTLTQQVADAVISMQLIDTQ